MDLAERFRRWTKSLPNVKRAMGEPLGLSTIPSLVRLPQTSGGASIGFTESITRSSYKRCGAQLAGTESRQGDRRRESSRARQREEKRSLGQTTRLLLDRSLFAISRRNSGFAGLLLQFVQGFFGFVEALFVCLRFAACTESLPGPSCQSSAGGCRRRRKTRRHGADIPVAARLAHGLADQPGLFGWRFSSASLYALLFGFAAVVGLTVAACRCVRGFFVRFG